MFNKDVLKNLKSGLVVFLVALPLCLGIALACNVPSFSGILAGCIAGIIVTVFSGSILSVSGPAAGLTSIVLASVASLGSFELFCAAVVCAGVLQIIMGVLRLGVVSDFIPNTVIKGMLAGIGIILILKQMPHLVGYDSDPEGDEEFIQIDGHNTLSELYYMFENISVGATVIGILSILILVFSETRLYKNNKTLSVIPAPLLVVVFGISLNMFFIFLKIPNLVISNEHVVNLPRITNVNEFKSQLILPNFSMLLTPKFIIVTFTLAIVASIETLLSIDAIDKLDELKRNSNSSKELFAQGIGNICSGLIGGLPVTSVIVRSSANLNSGATTKLSSIFHGVLLGLAVILLVPILSKIPNSCLAAILIFTGYKLAKPSLITRIFKQGYVQFFPFVITVIVMLCTDLLKGVICGLICSIILLLVSRFKLPSTIKTTVEHFKLTIHLPSHTTFLNKLKLKKLLISAKPNSEITIDASKTVHLDTDIEEVIENFETTIASRNIKLNKLNLN